MSVNKLERRLKIKKKVRSKIFGTSERPRLSIHRSNKEMYAQLIDDSESKTLAQASSRDKDIISKKVNKTEKSKLVGNLIAQKALEMKIETCIYDRGPFLYHGRVKALAEGAREKGLKF